LPNAGTSLDPAKIALCGAIAIVRRSIEMVDAQFECTLNNPLLFVMAAAHHQTGISTAAEADFGQPQHCIRNAPVVHSRLGMFDTAQAVAFSRKCGKRSLSSEP